MGQGVAGVRLGGGGEGGDTGRLPRLDQRSAGRWRVSHRCVHVSARLPGPTGRRQRQCAAEFHLVGRARRPEGGGGARLRTAAEAGGRESRADTETDDRQWKARPRFQQVK